MLRLSDLATPNGPALRIEGRLTSPDAELVRKAWMARRSPDVDLSWLTFIDETGASVLDELRRQGARLLHLPPLVAALLEKGLDVTTTPPPATIIPLIAPVPGGPEPPDAAADEARLLEALKAGNEDAFEQLVRTHAGRMLAVARRMLRDPQDAEDVVQESFAAAFRTVATFRAESRLATWLHRIVVNYALMKMRTRRRRPELALDALLPAFGRDGHRVAGTTEEVTAESVLTAAETRGQVRTAIDRLPAAYRTVLLLRDIDELDNGTVATMLGVSPNAVKIRLHRARQALLALLAPSFARQVPARQSATGRGRHSTMTLPTV